MAAWIHLIIVHFGIGLLLLGALCDMLGAWRHSERLLFAGFCNLVAATLFALVSVATGFVAEAHLGAHSNMGNALLGIHKSFAIAVAVLLIGLAGWRIGTRGGVHRRLHTVYLSLSFFVCALLLLTSAMGGVLVYSYGLGLPVETARNVINAQPTVPAAPKP